MTLRAERLCFAYPNSLPTLSDVDFTMVSGELHFIVGANGSGKSTLLRCLCGLLTPQSGAVNAPSRVSFLPQSVFPSQQFTVRQLVELGARLSATPDLNKILTQLDIAHLADRNLNEISGGEYQRVLVASVLAESPKFLLLDEPSSSLDLHHQVKLFSLLKNFCNAGLAIAVVCHDFNIASRFADNISLLHNNKIIESGSSKRVITQQNLSLLFNDSVTVSLINNNPVGVPADD